MLCEVLWNIVECCEMLRNLGGPGPHDRLDAQRWDTHLRVERCYHWGLLSRSFDAMVLKFQSQLDPQKRSLQTLVIVSCCAFT